MKKIKALLVDTNFSSIPIYQFLVQSGFDVFLVGGNENDFLAKNSKQYISKDYSNEEELEKIVNNFGIDYVVPGCNDHSYESCSRHSQKQFAVNIDSFNVSQQLLNKNEFRKIAAKIRLPVPNTYTLKQASGQDHRLIVKPVDAYSGRGISIIDPNDTDCLGSAVDCAKSFSRSGQFIIEDFISGQLYSHSAFIENHKVVQDFIVKEYGSTNPFAVDTSYVVHDYSKDILQAIRDDIERLAQKLDLTDGLIHTQFIQTDNKFWFIEVTRRCPGDLYSQLIELSTGFPYAAKYASYFVGKDIAVATTKPLKKRYLVRHTLTQLQSGIFSAISFKKKLDIIKQINISSVGDIIEPSPKGRVGIIFVEAQSEQSLFYLVDSFVNHQVYDIDFI